MSNTQESPSKVAILMCTYQGADHLEDQLLSISNQTHKNWLLWASDDNSTDGTREILYRYRENWGSERLSILKGPARGFVKNFLSLTCHSEIKADYFAYCDQDDVWEIDKLKRAINWLSTIAPQTPSLYCSRTLLIDEENNQIGFSCPPKKPPCFCNSIAQNIASGNTMVFNAAARNLLIQVGPSAPVAAHDWWLYMVVTGCGGKVFYDPHPTVRYRQHGNNVIGINSSFAARLNRIKFAFQGRLKTWNDNHLQALTKIQHELSPENFRSICIFRTSRQNSIIKRLSGLHRSGIHRQSVIGNIGMIFASVLKKF